MDGLRDRDIDINHTYFSSFDLFSQSYVSTLWSKYELQLKLYLELHLSLKWVKAPLSHFQAYN